MDDELAVAAGLMFFVVPHALAALSLRGRPWLLKVAGIVGLALAATSVMSPISMIMALPVLVVPSVFYLTRTPKSHRGHFRQRIPTIALAVVSVALMLGAVWVLVFLTKDPRCTLLVRRDGEVVRVDQQPCDPSNSGSLGPEVIEWSGASDTIALHESALALALSAVVMTLCALSAARS